MYLNIFCIVLLYNIIYIIYIKIYIIKGSTYFNLASELEYTLTIVSHIT